MKLIIAGGRDFTDYDRLYYDVERLYSQGACVTAVVCGCAVGADMLGARWAASRNIPVLPFPPDYVRYPKRMAPFVRNWEMAYEADALVAFHNGISGGTAHMIAAMNHLGKKVVVHMYTPTETHPKVKLYPPPAHLVGSTSSLL